MINKCFQTLSRRALQISGQCRHSAVTLTPKTTLLSSQFESQTHRTTSQTFSRTISTSNSLFSSTKMAKKLQVHTKTTNFAEAVEIAEQKIVEPKPDEVRVRQVYSGVNATDINITAARYFTDGVLPFSIGLEGVGVVDAVGSEVKNLKVGQPVAVLHNGTLEGFANYTNQKANAVFPLPSLDPKYIALLVCGLTASIGLDHQGRIKAGDKVLITAAAGGTGHIAVQWAKAKGCYVIGTASSQEKEDFLKSIGCDYVINYRKQNLNDALKEKFPEGIDVAWETIGGEVYHALFENLAPKGRMVLVGSIENYKTSTIRGGVIENLNARLLFKAASLNGFILFAFKDLMPEYFGKLVAAVEKGELKIKIDNGERSGAKFEGLESVVKAENWLHDGKNIGKVAVKIADL